MFADCLRGRRCKPFIGAARRHPEEAARGARAALARAARAGAGRPGRGARSRQRCTDLVSTPDGERGGRQRASRCMHLDRAASRPAAAAVARHHRAGVAVYLLHRPAARRRRRCARRRIGWSPDRGFDQAMRGLVRVAVAITAIVQQRPARPLPDGHLRRSSRWRCSVPMLVVRRTGPRCRRWPELPAATNGAMVALARDRPCRRGLRQATG